MCSETIDSISIIASAGACRSKLSGIVRWMKSFAIARKAKTFMVKRVESPGKYDEAYGYCPGGWRENG